MEFNRYVRILLLFAAVGATCLALADSDDNEHESHHRERDAKRFVSAAVDPTYKAECSSCHMLYPSGLLPARSWSKLMADLKNHFGENASLDKANQERISVFLQNQAADRSSMNRSKKIAQSIQPTDIPIRITETPYFKRQHSEIRGAIWQRKSIGSPAHCNACHAKAELGMFSEDDVFVPK